MTSDAIRPSGIRERLGEVVATQKSANAFARMCGISESGMRSYLSGRSVPSVDKVFAMAEVAGVRFEWLAIGKEPRNEEDLSDGPVPPKQVSQAVNHLLAAGYDPTTVEEVLEVDRETVRTIVLEGLRRPPGEREGSATLRRAIPVHLQLRDLVRRHVSYLELLPLSETPIDLVQKVEGLARTYTLLDEQFHKSRSTESRLLYEKIVSGSLSDTLQYIILFINVDPSGWDNEMAFAAIDKLDYYARALEEDGDYDAVARALFMAGKLYMYQGSMSKAKKCFQDAEEASPRVAKLFKDLGYT